MEQNEKSLGQNDAREPARAARIEDYALLADGQTTALVSRDGSIDWLCLPRFDSMAYFSALLGKEEHGHWQIKPLGECKAQRKYRPGSMLLETEFSTSTGRVRLTEALIVGETAPLLVRQLEGLDGRVTMEFRLVMKFDYGSVTPWVHETSYGVMGVAGSNEIHIQAPFKIGQSGSPNCDITFDVKQGSKLEFCLAWNHYAHQFVVKKDLAAKLEETDRYWQGVDQRLSYQGNYREAVQRSVLTLKSLIYEPTGGLVAAATTSLPENPGGARNWDYRYCWIRDSTFAMYALLSAGYTKEADAWRAWLIRTVAGDPAAVNILYGVDGERRLTEQEIPWLPGYENSRPVRVGNAAYQQVQLDIFGETIESLHVALKSGLSPEDDSWRVQEVFLEFLQEHWNDKDSGIWESRGGKQHFTHSKVMAWVAFDRAIRSAKLCHLDAPLKAWEKTRDLIHEEVCRNGFDQKLNSFTTYYGSGTVDASLLMLLMVGFLPPTDPRMHGTIQEIENQLIEDGLVLRYRTDEFHDNLEQSEGCFLPCSFWLADCWILMGQKEKARTLFERLLSLSNDVGLYSEEYDVHHRRFLGNFPQALTHVALVNTAFNLTKAGGPVHDRSSRQP